LTNRIVFDSFSSWVLFVCLFCVAIAIAILLLILATITLVSSACCFVLIQMCAVEKRKLPCFLDKNAVTSFRNSVLEHLVDQPHQQKRAKDIKKQQQA
jgi:hypothetical protein